MSSIKVESKDDGLGSAAMPECTSLSTVPDTEEDIKSENGSESYGDRETTMTIGSEQTSSKAHDEDLSLENTQKPGKKRGRKSKADRENGEPPGKRVKTEREASKAAANGETASKKSSRGRKPAGSSDAWTEEQDSYLRQLFTASAKPNITDIHQQFEQKYSTGRSRESIKKHWYNIKAKSLVLTPIEEQILKKAVDKYENDKVATVLDIYTKDGGANVSKLTQKFVSMKLNEWSKGGGITTSQPDADDNDNKSEDDLE
ncbi:hypothetical protein ABW21_db0203009 [Orbilia brochopaga]|nr:hypothetical protein ABW21_db0203009 [Drechslerella brochopaga]